LKIAISFGNSGRILARLNEANIVQRQWSSNNQGKKNTNQTSETWWGANFQVKSQNPKRPPAFLHPIKRKIAPLRASSSWGHWRGHSHKRVQKN